MALERGRPALRDREADSALPSSMVNPLN